MSSIEDKNSLDTLTNEAKLAQPGISPKNIALKSYISHTIRNTSNIDPTHYLQKGGTAMGTAAAPSYANIFITHHYLHKDREMHLLTPNKKEANSIM